MINDETIGVGIVTYERPDLFKRLFESIIPCIELIDRLIIVQDRKNDDTEELFGDRNYTYPYINHPKLNKPYNFEIINCGRNVGVAKSKNMCLDYLLNGSDHTKYKGDQACDHIFLIEDDMLIKDPNIFEKYIKTSKVTGIQHLMFGYHGPANKGGVSKGTPQPKVVIKYNDDISIALNQHCVGSFCYYSKKCIEDIGLIDENFKNAFDHVSHSYELALKGYSTPYWWWADVWDSNNYIEEQVCSEESSSIKTPERMKEWSNNIQKSMEYFKSKYGVLPFGVGGVDCQSKNEVFEFLKSIKP
jgi:GT2 family glycosyltransferase